jgi:tRNA (cmo5U34)-methyltransferase
MAERSIPLYRPTLDLIARLGFRYLRAGDAALDLGIATGAALTALKKLTTEESKRIRWIGIDNSPAMLRRARAAVPQAELLEWDLREGLPPEIYEARPRVLLCLWTAQFVPIEHRAQLYAACRQVVAPGGVLFVAEKLRGQTAAHQRILADEYRCWKLRQGYSVEAVEGKARSLEGALVSMDAPGQKAILMREGWSVEEIIRYLGFAAWQCLPVGAGGSERCAPGRSATAASTSS